MAELGDKFSSFLKALVFIICLGIFLSSALSVVRDFRGKMTNTVISHESLNRTNLPEITICPVPPLKDSNQSLTFDERAFGIEEVVTFDPSQWDVIETRTLFNGLCFSFNFRRAVGPVDVTFALILLLDVQVILSEPGLQPWLVYAYFPFSVTTAFLENKVEMVAAEIHLEKKETHIISNCYDYEADNSTFNTCAKTKLRQNLLGSLSCMLEEFEAFDLALPLCKTKEEVQKAQQTAKIEIIKFASHKRDTGCPDFCRKRSYDTHISYFHKSVLPHINETNLVLQIYYDSLLVETTTEQLVYDEGRLLSALGGSFGLLLGFSCFGILTSIIDVTHRYLKTFNKSNKRTFKQIKRPL